MNASVREGSAESPTSPLDALPQALQEELSQILERYLDELESGKRPDPNQLIADHPELAEALRHSLSGLEFLYRATATLGAGRAPEADELPYRELGDFLIKHEIGRGGMGVVYEAEQISIGRKVALKVLPFAAVLDQKQIARFNNEAQAAGQLNHPHIVPIYSVGCERGVHYYSMQLIDGQSLDLAIQELRVWAGELDVGELGSGLIGKSSGECGGGRDTAEQPDRHAAGAATNRSFSTARSVQSRDHIRLVAELGVQAAEGLHHAHEYGIVHRDIKPSNLLIDWQSKLWITDFGLARCQFGNNITVTGDLLGTVRYMSPEQAAGQAALVDHRSDIYSLGVTLYELLTLRQAFRAADRQELMRQIEQQEPIAPRQLNGAIPHDLETILLKAFAKSRDDRYESAQLLAEDLRRFLSGKPTLARRPTLVDRTAKWAVRHRKLVATAFAVMLFALLGTTVAALLIAREQRRTAGALQASDENLARARENFRQSRAAVDELGAMVTGELAGVPGMESFRRSLLRKTLHHYERFVQQAQGGLDLKFDLAFSYSKIGEIHGQLGEFSEAVAAYEHAERLYRELNREQPDVARFQVDLALCSNNRAHLLERQGQTEPAYAAYQRAETILRRLCRQHPGEGRYAQSLALALTNVGSLQRKTGQLTNALSTYREAVTLQKRLLVADPSNAELASQLAGSYNELSFLLGTEDLAASANHNDRAIEILRRLAEQEPTDWKWDAQLAACYNNRAAIYKRNEKLQDAKRAYESGIAVQERLARRAPNLVQLQYELGVSYNNLGQLLAAESASEAEERFLLARTIFEKLTGGSADSPRYRASLGGVLNNLALLRERAGENDKAAAIYEEAILHQETAWQRAPEIVEFRELLNTSYVNLGRLRRDQQRPDDTAALALKRKLLWAGNGKRNEISGAGEPQGSPRPAHEPIVPHGSPHEPTNEDSPPVL